MTRGNQRELSRQKAQKAALKKTDAHSILKDKEKSMNILCQICRQTFMCTSGRGILEQHVNSRHEKKNFQDCFPGI